jgi:hypothetical protein
MLYTKGPNDDLVAAEDALCAQVDPEIFFTSDTGGGVKEGSVGSYVAAGYARSLCAQCPLTVACLMTAVANKEKYGIWGGSMPHDRRTLRTKTQVIKFVEKLKKNYKE